MRQCRRYSYETENRKKKDQATHHTYNAMANGSVPVSPLSILAI
jgi:hypothetical protein